MLKRADNNTPNAIRKRPNFVISIAFEYSLKNQKQQHTHQLQNRLEREN